MKAAESPNGSELHSQSIQPGIASVPRD